MKIALIADLHAGIKKSDSIFQRSQLKFFTDQLVPELKAAGITKLFILGDVFDTRQAVNVQTDNVVIDLFKNTLKDFDIHVIVGNHDMYMATTTEVNSLKVLDLMPHVTVYEKPTEITLDGHNILMLPWITDYSKFEEIVPGHHEYCFCHADIIGFNMGGRLSDSGLMASTLLDHIDHVYSGHYHNGYTRKYEKNKSITYLGSPYQLTRIDRGDTKGYHILDLDTNEDVLHENTQSIKFTKHTFPDVDLSVIAGNVVDLEIPFELSDQTKKIYSLVDKLEKLKPAYPVNINILPADDTTEEVELSGETLNNIMSLFKTYLEQHDTPLNKDELYASFTELYNSYKEQS